MICVRRSRNPPLLGSKAIEQERPAAAKFFRSSQRSAQPSFGFEGHRQFEVVAGLTEPFHHKYAFCERLAIVTPLEIEQHRPRARAVIPNRGHRAALVRLSALDSLVDAAERRHKTPLASVVQGVDYANVVPSLANDCG